MIGLLGFAFAYAVVSTYAVWRMIPKAVKAFPGITHLASLVRTRRLLRGAQLAHLAMFITVYPHSSSQVDVWSFLAADMIVLAWQFRPPPELHLRILELTARNQFTEDSPAWPPPR